MHDAMPAGVGEHVGRQDGLVTGKDVPGDDGQGGEIVPPVLSHSVDMGGGSVTGRMEAADTGTPGAAAVSGGAGREIGISSVAPGIAASETEMIFLCFSIESGKVSLLSQSIVQGNMRLTTTIAPADGLYSRLMSARGEVLAQQVMDDPRRLYYDFPVSEGSGRLTGGAILLSNVQFAVRYPLIPGGDTIELFRVVETQQLSTLTAKDSGFYGVFKLTKPAR